MVVKENLDRNKTKNKNKMKAVRSFKAQKRMKSNMIGNDEADDFFI